MKIPYLSKSYGSLILAAITAFTYLFGANNVAQAAPAPRFIDLADDHYRQTVVDHEYGQYLGHPTTVLLDNGKTLLSVYPKGHGKGGIVYKRSSDGGLTWSDRLPTPNS